ncbi:bcl-2-like protein 11 [Aplochiton taeniatus]
MAEAQISETWEDLYEDPSLSPDWPYIPTPPVAAGDMRPPEEVGQNLRRIGDEYFNLLMQRRQAEPHPQIHHEPVLMLWMGLLIGRLLQIFFWRR